MTNYNVVITEHKNHVMNVWATNKEEAEDLAEDEFMKEFEPEEDWNILSVEEAD